MKHIAALGLILLVSCGVDNKGINDAAETLSNSQTGGVQSQPEPAKEVVVVFRQDEDRTSIMVDQVKDLPACDNFGAGRFAYVNGLDKFFQCSGTAWVEFIDPEPIPAPETPAVKDGQTKDVPASVEPVVSEPSTDVASEEMVWTDPLTKKAWKLSQFVSRTSLHTRPACLVSPYNKFASRGELAGAISRGLFEFAASYANGGIKRLWTNDQVPHPRQPGYTTVGVVGADGEFVSDPLETFTNGAACTTF